MDFLVENFLLWGHWGMLSTKFSVRTSRYWACGMGRGVMLPACWLASGNTLWHGLLGKLSKVNKKKPGHIGLHCIHWKSLCPLHTNSGLTSMEEQYSVVGFFETVWDLDTLIGKLSQILMDFYNYFYMATIMYLPYSARFLWSLN